jgi:hypothetical protein
MADELNKPLGQKKPRQRRSMPVVMGVALAFSGALLGWAAVSVFRPPQPEPKVAESPSEPQPLPNQQTTKSEPQPEKPADPNAKPLEAVEPDGEISEKVPVPTPARRQESGLAHLPDPELTEKGEFGLLPKLGADGQRPMDVYSRPPATEGNFGVARVVIIVGGIGISQTSSQQAVRQLPPAVTLAFAPYGNSLLRWMQEARKKGHELLLQVPMEPFDYPANNPGEHTLLAGAAPGEIVSDLHWSMSRITNYVGVINFLGGKFVSDKAAMKPAFDELAGRGLLFVDDGSAKNTLSGEAAVLSLLPYGRANVQIDAMRTRAAIAEQLEKLAAEAKRTGLAIGVANAFPESIELVARFAEEAAAKGIEITPVSAVVKEPEGRRQ